MFRPMRRSRQQLPAEECIGILRQELRGVLSVLGDDGYPYGMPMNHWYCEEDGHLYFHCSKVGHRMESLLRCPKVSFCVYDQGFRKPGDWALNIRSVIVFGQARLVEDHDRAVEIAAKLALKFTQDQEYIAQEVARSGPAVAVFELIPEHITGKLVKES